MYNEKSVLEFRIESDAYLIAKDRHRQIYMDEYGESFLIFHSSNQSGARIKIGDVKHRVS